jgi:hypothetical protein
MSVSISLQHFSLGERWLRILKAAACRALTEQGLFQGMIWLVALKYCRPFIFSSFQWQSANATFIPMSFCFNYPCASELGPTVTLRGSLWLYSCFYVIILVGIGYYVLYSLWLVTICLFLL